MIDPLAAASAASATATMPYGRLLTVPGAPVDVLTGVSQPPGQKRDTGARPSGDLAPHCLQWPPGWTRALTKGSATVPAPDLDPHLRDPDAVAPADSYRRLDPVWVYRAQGWHAGVVERSSPLAVTVTYRPPDTRGTGVDTLTAAYLLPREDEDPLLDQERD